MKVQKTIVLHWVVLLAIALNACKKDKASPTPTPKKEYRFTHEGLKAPQLPKDNPFSNEGIELGKRLFYEKQLSKDGSQSCASCHKQEFAFSDNDRFSLGVKKLPGKRQAMAIFNMAWHTNEFFWDGRAHLLRDQALLPIQDELEMDESLENVLKKLNASKDYKQRFKTVYKTDTIKEKHLALALEQFMLTIVSNKSKYDKVLAGKASFTPSELRGKNLFFTAFDKDKPGNGASCLLCHGGDNFDNNEYMNNGLDPVNQQKDLGRYTVTGIDLHQARFKVPSLRNIEVTAPYMHDGRFKTLEEVIDHYNHGVKLSPSINPTMGSIQANGGLQLNQQNKEDLIAFLKTLTDHNLLQNPDLADPF